ncbi:hypothetical protein V2J09_019940 [Rumex salicifolius]
MARPPVDHTGTSTIKFLCSYGGKILPRHSDAKLRYVGGHTRVLAVDRSISFSELLLKLEDLCGTTVCLKCQLPTEDLDALISIKSDQDLVHLIEEYGLGNSNRSSLKIRAFLLNPKTGHQQKTSPSSSDTSSPKSSSSSSSSFSSTSAVGSASSSRFSAPMTRPTVDRCNHQAPAMAFPVRRYAYNHNGNTSNVYLVPSGSHWQ